MLLHLRRMLSYLRYPDRNGGVRISYQCLIRELRAVINSNEYQRITSSDLQDLSPNHKAIREFIRTFCLIRWSDTHLYHYLKDIVRLSVEHDKMPLDLRPEAFDEDVLRVNAMVKESPLNKKSRLALEYQKLCGAMGVEDFCGSKNTPNVRHIQTYKDRDGIEHKITYVRHGTPTALGDDYYSIGIGARKAVGPFVRLWNRFSPKFALEINGGEEVTVDYKEYLRALEERKQSELFCVYQRRTPDIIEDERSRVLRIEALQETHPNIHVLTQPVEGDLFQHRGKYRPLTTFSDLKSSLEREFFDNDPASPNTRASLPLCLRSDHAYRDAFRKLMDDVQEIFFSNEESVVDLNANRSLIDLDERLDREFETQARRIEDQLKNLNLNALQKEEEPVDLDYKELVLEKILQDGWICESVLERMKDQITNLDMLAKWIPAEMIEQERSLDTNFEDKRILAALLHSVIGAVVDATLKADKTVQKLEEQKEQFLTNWQSFILLFYAFQKMDLKVRLNGVRGYDLSVYKTPCKDFLDRGGNQAFVEDRLLHYMLRQEGDRKRLEEALFNLIGPPILVKKKEAIPRRIIPGMKVEQLLKQLSPDARERLSEYTFGEAGWKIDTLHTPRVRGQKGMPNITEGIRQQIAAVIPSLSDDNGEDGVLDQVIGILKKFSGIDLKQWESLNIEDLEGGYKTEGSFLEDKIQQQVDRDLKATAGGIKHRVIQEGKRAAIKSYDDLKPLILAHPTIAGDEQKALKVLSSFHQGIGGEVHCFILGIERLPELIRLKNKETREVNKYTCSYELDLSNPEKIVFNYFDTYECYEMTSEVPEVTLRTFAKVEHKMGDSGLESEGFVRWSVL